MPFYGLEGMKSYRFNPHLSTADGPVIEGATMYFLMVANKAGTGAELHYHPNELMALPLQGKGDCVVGNDRQIVGPDTFVHFPPYARHAQRPPHPAAAAGAGQGGRDLSVAGEGGAYCPEDLKHLPHTV